MNSDDTVFAIGWVASAIIIIFLSITISQCTIDKNKHLNVQRLKAIENNCLYLKAETGYNILCGLELRKSK